MSRYAKGLLGIDPKAARIAWTVFLLALLLATAYAVRETLAVFVIALLFAYLLAPLVGFVERITPRQVSPRIALAIVYLALVGAIVALALTLGSRLADEANALAMRLPDLVKNPEWMQKIPLPGWLEPARASMIQKVRRAIEQRRTTDPALYQRTGRATRLRREVRALPGSDSDSRVLLPERWSRNSR